MRVVGEGQKRVVMGFGVGRRGLAVSRGPARVERLTRSPWPRLIGAWPRLVLAIHYFTSSSAEPACVSIYLMHAQGTPPPDLTAQQKILLADYQEGCKSDSGITDFRPKILALLPIACGGDGAYPTSVRRRRIASGINGSKHWRSRASGHHREKSNRPCIGNHSSGRGGWLSHLPLRHSGVAFRRGSRLGKAHLTRGSQTCAKHSASGSSAPAREPSSAGPER